MRAKEEALKLFEENKRLVRFMYNKYFKFVRVEDGDDLIQEGMIALYQASKNFDEAKNIKFCTYASKAIFYAMHKYNNRYLKKYSNTNSLNEICGADENIEKLEFIEDMSVDFSEIEAKELIEEVLKNATEKEKLIFKLRIEDKTQREIAKMIGLTQPYVGKILRDLANNIRKIQGGEPIAPRVVNRTKIANERVDMLRREARKLKEDGANYNEIASKLNIPKGSVSSYLRAS